MSVAMMAPLYVTNREICCLSRFAAVGPPHLPEAENKVWHAHPVWFLDTNPVVGYSKLKTCVRLLFWSGQSFEEEGLAKEGNFKAAEARYTAAGGSSDAGVRGSLGLFLRNTLRPVWARYSAALRRAASRATSR
jgi:hypothetical protein